MENISLSMQNATYGRDSSKLENLKNEYASKIAKIKESLTGEEYDQLKNLINQNWSGADKDAYVEKLKESIKKIEDKLDQVKSKIDETLNDDLTEFNTTTRNNVNLIK